MAQAPNLLAEPSRGLSVWKCWAPRFQNKNVEELGENKGQLKDRKALTNRRESLIVKRLAHE